MSKIDYLLKKKNGDIYMLCRKNIFYDPITNQPQETFYSQGREYTEQGLFNRIRNEYKKMKIHYDISIKPEMRAKVALQIFEWEETD